MLTNESRRQDFPTLQNIVYLNTAAEGIPPFQISTALAQYFADKQLGMDGRPAHAAQRAKVQELTAALYGLRSDEIGICSCSSEAFNLASMALRLGAGDEVVINDLDFPAGVTPWLQPSSQATVRLWQAREGALRVEDLARLLSPKTRLVTVSLVSFFNGYKIPLAEVVRVVRDKSDALIAVDVTQALGRIPLELAGVDFVVSSTHKWILASHGGGLVGIPSARAEEFTVPAGGWFHLEDAFGPERFVRAVSKPGAASFGIGMPNYPAIYAVRAGLAYVSDVGIRAIDEYARPLVRECLRGLARLPVELLTPQEEEALAGIVAFRHPAMDRLHRQLLEAGIHVMSQAGRMRIAIHGYNTADDVDQLLRVLTDALAKETDGQ